MKKIDEKTIAKRLNEITGDIKNYKYNDVLTLFKLHKIPFYYTLIPYFTREGYMALNEDGLYNWVKSTPVYFKEIESIIDPIRKRNKLNSIKEKEKFTQEEAIAFLKELGYKIMKPVTEFVEI